MSDWCEIRDGRARRQAQAIIQELGLEDPDELRIESIAFLRGATVLERPLRGCEGRLVRNGDRAYITVSSAIPELGRKRFAIAHELGHYELHVTESTSQLALFQDKDLSAYWYKKVDPHEQEANIFASELLMPEKMFKPRCLKVQPSLSLVSELADVFTTTLTATARRYVAFSPYDCALVYSDNGNRKWFVPSEDFPLRIRRGALESPAAIKILQGQADGQGMISGSAAHWFEGKGVTPRLRVQEDSRRLGRYNGLLTLLWLKDDVDVSSWYSD